MSEHEEPAPAAAADIARDATKDPDDWATGDEPATGPQLSYLRTLAREAGETVPEPESLTKAEAPKLIDRLQSRSQQVAGQQTLDS